MADLAVICGATGGLGTAIVDVFARRGDRVIAVARSRAEVSQLEASYPNQVSGDTADLTARLAVDELWERIDRIGAPRWVVNATGGFRGGRVVDTTPDDFTLMMDLNLGTAWWSCRAAARRMQRTTSPSPSVGAGTTSPSPSVGASATSPSPFGGSGTTSPSPFGGGQGGGIVNVASRSALTAEPGAAVYAIAKAGVIKLTEVLAAELKNAGVRVNAVVPAVIDTPANRQSLPEKLMQKAVPPAEIAEVIAYLCSDAAQAITGTAIPVYGKF